MEAAERKALALKPKDYYHVRSGPIEPDDLMFSPCEGIYRPANDPEWLFNPPPDAEEAFCVIRKVEHRPAPDQTVRTYTIKREDGQVNLFE